MGGGMRVPPGPPVDPLNALGAGAAAAGPARPRGENPEQEVLILKAQAEAMMAQLQAINARISQIRRGAAPAPSEITEPKARRKASRDVKSPQMAAIVDEERCVSCGICVDVCPEGAITESVTVLVDLQKCTGCGLCIDECPNEAISLTKLKAAAS
jgi:NAD-dependent dihydropyrimidine dehydrogenase PreA subunit